METDILKQAALIMARRSKSFSQTDISKVSALCAENLKYPEVLCIAKEKQEKLTADWKML